MRKILVAFLFILFGAGISKAQVFPVRDWCQLGSQQVNTAGLPSTTKVQGSFPSCTVTVFVHGGGLATIFADASSTPLSNPFTAQTNGQWIFYVATGRYDVQLSGGGLPNTVTFSDINVATGGAGGTGAAGIPIQTQVNNGGGPPNVFGGAGCQTFANKDTGPQNNDCDTHFRGPNPYVDATRYGVRPVTSRLAIPAISGITATVTGGSPTVTVSTTSCPFQTGNVCFVNGDGVVIQGAGATQTMTTPAAPTIAPSNANLGTSTGFGAPAPAGATTYNYKVFQCDLGGGCTAPSAAGSTNTGNANLGFQTPLAVTSATRSNDVITFNTPSQPPFGVGAMVAVSAGVGSAIVTPADLGFLGWYSVASVTGTGFTVNFTGLDTRNGAAPATTSSFTNVTVTWWNFNKVTWTNPNGTTAFRSFVCSDRASPGTYHVLGQSVLPVNPSDSTFIFGTTEFDDYGATMMQQSGTSVAGGGATGYALPWYVSDANCTGTATNDNWVTTIQSGAGTTTLTMTSNAPNSVSGQAIRFDNTPNLLAAVTANVSGFFGNPIELPFTSSGAYIFNSLVDLRTNSPTLLLPQGLISYDTILIGRTARWFGDRIPGKGSQDSFQSVSVPFIEVYVSPAVYEVSSSGSFTMSGLKIDGTQNGVGFMVDGGGAQFGGIVTDMTFTSGLGFGTDYTGMALVCRGASSQGSSCGMSLTGRSLTSSGDQTFGKSAAPAVFCVGCGKLDIDYWMTSGRTMVFLPDLGGAGGVLSIGAGDFQGSGMPLIISNDENSTNSITLGTRSVMSLDTTFNPCVVSLANGGRVSTTVVSLLSAGCFPSGQNQPNMQALSGFRMGQVFGQISYNGQSINGQNRNIVRTQTGSGLDSIMNPTNQGDYGIYKVDAAIGSGTGFPIFVDSIAPLNFSASVTAGGSVPVGTHLYSIAPVWQTNGGVGESSFLQVTTTTGNQTVNLSWTAVPGNCKGYNVYRDGTAMLATFPLVSGCTTTTFIDAQATTFGGTGPPTIPAGSATMLLPGAQGMAAATYTINAPGTGSTALSMPASTGVARSVFFPDLNVSWQTGASTPTNAISVIATNKQTAYDNFNRANGAIGSNWTFNLNNALNVSGNTVVGTSTSSGIFFNNTISPAADEFSQISVAVAPTTNTGDVVGISVRNGASGVSSAYGYTCEGNVGRAIVKDVTNAFSTIAGPTGTPTAPCVAGDALRLEAVGSSLTAFRNGVVDLTATDTSLTSGGVGLWIAQGTTAAGDNWSGGNLHPIGQLDIEQDWTQQPQHFSSMTVGPTNPVPGALSPGLYASNVTDSALTAGNCVQATTGGLLQTTAGACGTSSGTVTTTGSPASGNLTKFSGATSITNGDLSGDATTSGTLAVTVTKINGNSVPSGVAANQVLVGTAANTFSFETVPNCLDTVGQHLNYNNSTQTFTCGTSNITRTATNSSVCTTSNSSYATCSTTITWNNSGFADTNYVATCLGSGPSGFPAIVGASSQSATTITIVITNGTSNGAQSSTYSSISCIGVHN
jgi:hypothetical protein